MTELLLLSLLIITYLLQAIPGYTLARRRGLRAPGLAFIPLVGLWVVVFRSIGWTGWAQGILVAVLILLPLAGLVLTVWGGIQVPFVHRRSRWWIPVLAIPGVYLFGYCGYAFTLPRPEAVQLPEPISL